MSDCIFCKIIAGEIPAKKLAESPHAIVIADIQPQAPIHALVIPKKHVASLDALSADDRTTILPQMYQLVDQFVNERAIQSGGYRTVINTGKHAGQTVQHLHMHVLGGALLRTFGT